MYGDQFGEFVCGYRDLNCDHIFMGRLKKRLRDSAPLFLSEMYVNLYLNMGNHQLSLS